MFVRNGVTFSLDTREPVQVNAREYVLHGWCFANNASDRLEIFARVEGADFPGILGFSRPDLIKHFGDPRLANCGCLLRFRCERGPVSVGVFARLNGVELLLESILVPETPVRAKPPKLSSYQEWIRWKEPEMFWTQDEFSRYAPTLDYRPTISIILPTYNTPPYFLIRCIQSVLDQQYLNWQLCISDDNSSDDHVISTIEQFAQRDARIHFQRNATQGGISVASNVALNQASGDFVVLLDHDDELHPSALLEVVRALNEGVAYQLLYSDEDKIDQYGARSQPAFKPDFDKDAFLSFNYLGHLVALKRDIVTEIGGFRPCCDGAQDWDLLIRAVEIVDSRAIRHIRKPLYHWRMHDSSTSVNLDAKPYCSKSWIRVLEDHTRRTTQKVTVSPGLFYGSMRLKYPSPKNIQIGVFLRAADGIFQSAIVRTSKGGRPLHVYQIIESVVVHESEHRTRDLQYLRNSPANVVQHNGVSG